MPTSVAQLSASRELTVVRRPLRCESTATVLRQGPAGECGGAPGWLLFLCPEHSQSLPDWPGIAADTEGPLGLSCGAALDYRTTEQVLQSHAALWFTPVTGVDPATCAGGWSEALDLAHRVFADRLEETGAEGETLNSLTLMLGMAAENAATGNLYQACVPLGWGETLSQNL